MSGYDHDPRRDYEDPRYRHEPGYDLHPSEIRRRQEIIYDRIAGVVWFILGAIVVLILLRVVLRMINANAENAFVDWVYRTSQFFVRPFLGITNDPAINGYVFEVNSLIAILIYVLVIYGILQLTRVILDLLLPPEV